MDLSSDQKCQAIGNQIALTWRSLVGEEPVQLLKARENALCSEKPSNIEISVWVKTIGFYSCPVSSTTDISVYVYVNCLTI